MNKQEAIEVRKKMILCVKNHSWASRNNPRCPSITKMYEYIKFKHPDWGARLDERSTYKYTKASGMRYTTGGGEREYVGKTLVVEIDGRRIIDHDTTETYRTNMEVAEKILQLENYD